MKFIILLALFAFATCSQVVYQFTEEEAKAALKDLEKPHDELWAAFHKIHTKGYHPDSVEGQKRKEHFKKSIDHIKNHKSKGKKFSLKIGPFADLSHEEFKSLVSADINLDNIPIPGANTPRFSQADKNSSLRKKAPVNLDLTIDWTSKMMPVRNQKKCNSCWAFATAATIEGNMAIQGNAPPSWLSPQALVDCDTEETGCKGGRPPLVMQWIKTNGIPLDSDYPYQGAQGTGCGVPPGKSIYKTTGWTGVGPTNTINDWVALLSKGPISVVILGANPDLQHFGTGTWTPSAADCPKYDHSVVAVGWRKDPTTGKYLIKCKNSWGEGWGSSGYFEIEYNIDSNNTCWVTSYGYIPKLV